ncbi:helix-turn-helix domain-containing protein [soil metagenome]
MVAATRGGIRQTGRGRILFWRGGSLWIGRAEESTGFHSHHAIQMTFALDDGELRLRSPGEDWKKYSAAIVPAHQDHAFDARGELVALVFVEPESREGQAIRAQYCEGIAALPDQTMRAEIAALAQAYEHKHSDQDLIERARAVASGLAAVLATPPSPVDKRILRAIELLHEQLGQAINLSDIAEAVHLSPERFRHLFIEQTGIRFRPYVLWLRLSSSISAYAAGASLTDASYAGGFADSAHFSRTFKRMFGVAPVSIRPE